MKIRTKIISVFLFVSLLSMAGVGYFVTYFAKEQLISVRGEMLSALAFERKRDIHHILTAWKDRSRLIASRTQLRLTMEKHLRHHHHHEQAQHVKMERILNDALGSVRHIQAITLCDLSGNLVVQVTKGEQEKYSCSDLAKEKSNVFKLKDVYLAQQGDTQQLQAVMVGPVVLNEKKIGVIHTVFEAGELLEIVRNYNGLGETGETLLVRRDENGNAEFFTPLRHRPVFDHGLIVQKDQSNVATTQALMKKETFFLDEDIVDYRGVPALTATAYIKELDWGVVAKIDREEALKPVDVLLAQVMWVALAAVITLIVLGVCVGNAIAKPIIALAEVAEKIRIGDLSARAQVMTQDETGLLAETFNSTLDELETYTNRLRLLELVVESSDDIIFVTKPDVEKPEIVYVNQAVQSFYGCSAEKIIGEVPAIFEGEGIGAKQLKALKAQLKKDKAFIGEVLIHNKNDEECWMQVQVMPVKDVAGKTVNFAVVEREITLRKQAEEKIKSANAFLDLMIAHIPDFIFVKDKEFKIVQANPAFLSAYPKEMQNKIIGYTTIEEYPKEDAEAFLAKDKEAFEKGCSETIETVMFPDGKERILSTKKIRFEDSEGKAFILGIARDVTEREILISALERSNQDLDEFAYVASHDLKAPLRVIDNASQWLEEDFGEVLDEDGKENMALLRNRVYRMEKLLDDLLEYSRIGRKVDEGNAEVIVGNEMAENIALLLAPPKGFSLSFNSAFEKAEFYKMPLQQVLLNLISNAIKHHDKDDGTVEVLLEDLGEKYGISVSDDGPGVAKEFHDKMFAMFQTLKPRDQVEGSGMGLAMVKKHVEHLGGEITLKSEEGKGCCFYFTWPKK